MTWRFRLVGDFFANPQWLSKGEKRNYPPLEGPQGINVAWLKHPETAVLEFHQLIHRESLMKGASLAWQDAIRSHPHLRFPYFVP